MNDRQYTLKELRARKNVRQSDAASALGISTQTYNKWEKDISKVAIGKVIDVARYYEVNISDIFVP